MLNNLNRYKILLASKSPRRRELLTQLRVPFNVITIGGINESYPKDLPALEVPLYIGMAKARVYAAHIHENEMVITADTVVICDERIMGKPKDAAEAHEMLRFLSGKTHRVATGVVITTAEKQESFTTVTEVTFSELTDGEINYYVENYLPYDKAGGYGIQEWIGAVAVSSIKGSYYNVMGLPVHQLYQHLKQF